MHSFSWYHYAFIFSEFVFPHSLQLSGNQHPHFCSWDVVLTQEYKCSSPKKLGKCTESPSTLLTNNSLEWNLCLSWSNHPVPSFRLEMNVGAYQTIETKRVIPTDAKFTFSPLVSLKSISVLWKEFLRSGLNCRFLNVW